MADKIHHKKQFGQNFLKDEKLLASIVADGGITKDDTVLEIGTGAAALTLPLARTCKKLITYEIDKDLKSVLDTKLVGFDNVEIIFEDFLKRSENKVSPPYKVVANLPYYITTPILFELIESDNQPQCITIMVQKEVAERLTATPKKGDYGAVSAALRLYGESKITRIVDRKQFTPAPNVDSAVIRIDKSDTFDNVDKKYIAKIIRICFTMRRKTLVNNLTAGFSLSKERANEIVTRLEKPLTVRAENLTTEEFVMLGSILSK